MAKEKFYENVGLFLFIKHYSAWLGKTETDHFYISDLSWNNFLELKFFCIDSIFIKTAIFLFDFGCDLMWVNLPKPYDENPDSNNFSTLPELKTNFVWATKLFVANQFLQKKTFMVQMLILVFRKTFLLMLNYVGYVPQRRWICNRGKE